MGQKQEQINEITVTRTTKAKGELVRRGEVLTVGDDIDKNDARLLLRMGKAVPGKQTRIAEEAAEEKKTADAARKQAADKAAVSVAEAERRADEAEADAEAAEERAAEAEKRAVEAEKRAAEAEKALAAAKKNDK